MPPLGFVLVITMQLPGGEIAAHARPVPRIDDVPPAIVCAQMAMQYLAEPLRDPRLASEVDKRGAVCVAVPVGGEDS